MRMTRCHGVLLVAGVLCGCQGKSAPPSPPVAFGKTCEPFGVAVGIMPGMTAAAAEAAGTANAKALGPIAWSTSDLLMTTVDAAHNTYAVHFRDGKVDALTIQLFPRRLDELRAAWGPGEPTIEATARERLFYTDAAKSIRCEANAVGGESVNVRFLAMVPLATYLGDGPTLTFLGVGLLGSPVATIERALAAKGATVDTSATEHSIHDLPPSDGGYPPNLALTPGPDGTASSLRITYPLETERARTELLARLAAKFGEPTTRDGASIYRVEGRDARLTIAAELARLTVL